MWKRIVIALLALTVLFVGCGQKANQTGSNSTSTASTKDTKVETTKEASGKDYSKPITIVTYQSSSQGAQPEDKDEILKVLEEKFNIDLKINVITSEYESKLNLEVSSGNIPDIMKVSSAQFNAFLDQDLLLPIEDYIPRMPNFLSRYPDILEDKTLRVDGHLYFLAGHNPLDRICKSYDSLWIRKDWLDKLNLEVPTTLEELKEVAIAFTTQDPDGNGVNDTFGYSGLGAVDFDSAHFLFNPIFGAFGIGPEDYTLQDGKLVYGAATPEYKEALAWIRDFIATGAVDPDITLMSTFDEIREKVYRNQIGLMYFSWAEFIKPPYDDTLKQMTPDAEWIQIAPPIGPHGAADSTWSVPGYASSGWVLSADLADNPEKLNRVLDYLDYISAGEGLNLVCYGIEGKHYNITSDGSIQPTDKVGEVSYAWTHQLMGRDEIVYLKTKFPTCWDAVAYANSLNRIDSYNNFVGIPSGLNKSDLLRYVEEETVQFIYGKRDIATFDNFVKTLNNTYGLQQYLDMGTATLKEAGIIN